jgi:uncharacterized protein (TIRG00374 family)
MKTKFSIFAGILLGVFFLYLAFKNIDFSGLIKSISRINILYLVPFLIFVIAELLVRSLRWKLLLKPSKDIKVFDTFKLEAIGLGLNNILPLRLGELVRGVFCGRIFQIPVMTVLSTILVERGLDTITLFMIFAISMKFDPLGSEIKNFGAYFWLIMGILVLLMFVLIFMDELLLHRKLSPLFSKFPKMEKFITQVALGARGFTSLKNSIYIIISGFVLWLCDGVNAWIMAKAFGIDETINFIRGVKVVFAAAIAASIPGMPGYFGNLEYSISKLLGVWGIDQTTSLAYATLLHIYGYVIITLLGLFFIYRMGHSLITIWNQFSSKSNPYCNTGL